MHHPDLPHFMRCIASPARGIPIKAGTFSPVLSVDGRTPNRNATIVDCWGGSQLVCEREDGRWELAAGDGPAAQFVPA